MSNDKLPQGWRSQKVKDLSETYAGGTPSRSVSGMFGGDIPWVKSSELNRDEISTTEERLTEFGYKSSSVKWVPANTPLVAMYGATAGVMSWLKIPAVTNQAVLAIPPRDSSVDSRWLYWILKFYADKLIATVQGSGQPNLSKKLIDELEVGKPLLVAEQQKIANILDTIDNLIALTDRHIAKLKLAKAGLLHDLLTRGIDENGELRDPIAHPEQFQETGTVIGRIPKDWSFSKMSDFYAIPARNGLYKHIQYYGRGTLMIHMPQMFRGLEIDISDAVRVEVVPNELERFGLCQGDLVFARRSLNLEGAGRCSLVPQLLEPATFESSIIRVRLSIDELIPKFVNYFLNSEIGTRLRLPLIRQVAVSGVSSEDIASLSIPKPKITEQREIINRIEGYNNLIHIKETQQDKLKLLKKGLMTDLLTGRVRVNLDLIEEG